MTALQALSSAGIPGVNRPSVFEAPSSCCLAYVDYAFTKVISDSDIVHSRRFFFSFVVDKSIKCLSHSPSSRVLILAFLGYPKPGFQPINCTRISKRRTMHHKRI
jgi:hypothetical protein